MFCKRAGKLKKNIYHLHKYVNIFIRDWSMFMGQRGPVQRGRGHDILDIWKGPVFFPKTLYQKTKPNTWGKYFLALKTVKNCTCTLTYLSKLYTLSLNHFKWLKYLEMKCIWHISNYILSLSMEEETHTVNRLKSW